VLIKTTRLATWILLLNLLQSRKKKEKKNNEKDHVKKKKIVSPQAPRCQLKSMYIASASIFFPDETLLPPQKITKDGYFQLLMSLLPYTKANKLMQK
jgi:hypothetical protein